MKAVAIGADISINDVNCSKQLIYNLEKDVSTLMDIGAEKAALTNITGDDVVITAFVEDNLVKKVNREIVKILIENAEDIGDIAGISSDPKKAGEGISYAEAKARKDRYHDAIIVSFDTYGGESIVNKVANSVISAAEGMEGVTDVSQKINSNVKNIPGVGYVSGNTDDPVVVATIEDMKNIGTVAGAMIGAAIGNENVYLVKRASPSYVIPGSVIFTITAFMNGNVIDLAVPFEHRFKVLKP